MKGKYLFHIIDEPHLQGLNVKVNEMLNETIEGQKPWRLHGNIFTYVTDLRIHFVQALTRER